MTSIFQDSGSFLAKKKKKKKKNVLKIRIREFSEKLKTELDILINKKLKSNF